MKRIRYILSITVVLFFFLTLPVEAQDNDNTKKWVVVIDPGHGGHDPGAVRGTFKEKDITLAMALKLGKMLEKVEGVEVIYTREKDEFLELYKRAEIANKNKADLFISIHCNAVSSVKPYGVETWVMGLHRSKENLEVAKKENAAVLLEEDYVKQYDGFDPNSVEADIVFSLYQNAFLEQSVAFASLVQNGIIARAKRFNRGVKQAGFLVLYKTTMPGILIETGFISNENERKYLSSDAGQKAIATGIYDAFLKYKCSIDGVIIEQTDVAADADSLALTDPADGSGEKNNALPVVNNKEQPLSDNHLENIKPELYYSVQIFVSSLEKDNDDPVFDGLDDVHVYTQNNVYKYLAGHYKTLREASDSCQRIRKLSVYTDAFVVAFYKGNRISTDEAKILSKE